MQNNFTFERQLYFANTCNLAHLTCPSFKICAHIKSGRLHLAWSSTAPSLSPSLSLHLSLAPITWQQLRKQGNPFSLSLLLWHITERDWKTKRLAFNSEPFRLAYLHIARVPSPRTLHLLLAYGFARMQVRTLVDSGSGREVWELRQAGTTQGRKKRSSLISSCHNLQSLLCLTGRSKERTYFRISCCFRVGPFWTQFSGP